MPSSGSKDKRVSDKAIEQGSDRARQLLLEALARVHCPDGPELAAELVKTASSHIGVSAPIAFFKMLVALAAANPETEDRCRAAVPDMFDRRYFTAQVRTARLRSKLVGPGTTPAAA